MLRLFVCFCDLFHSPPHQRLARIVALPESHVAVLQMNPKTSASTSPTRDGYFYTDAGGLLWDHRRGVWTKEDLAADLSTSRLSPSPPSLFTLHHPHTSTLSLESYSRGTTPEPHARPLSQMSFFSDDLQTIPSQDVSHTVFTVALSVCF